jgi:hypothetical protein
MYLVDIFDTVRYTPLHCNAMIIGMFGQFFLLAVGNVLKEDYILADRADIGVLV